MRIMEVGQSRTDFHLRLHLNFSCQTTFSLMSKPRLQPDSRECCCKATINYYCSTLGHSVESCIQIWFTKSIVIECRSKQAQDVMTSDLSVRIKAKLIESARLVSGGQSTRQVSILSKKNKLKTLPCTHELFS